MSAVVETAAERLRIAYGGITIPPLRDLLNPTDADGAYAVQTANTRFWQAQGREIVGRKIGLTAKAVQQQLGVDRPDFGVLFRDMQISDGGTLSRRRVLQAKAEAEVALVMARDVDKPDATPADLLAASDYAVAAIEIVDSRIADWKIKLVDTIADNASYGGFTLGPWDRNVAEVDLSSLILSIRQNGTMAAEGPASAVMGHPAISTAWLANKLSEFDVSLEPGDIVISGGITKMLPVGAGDEFVFSLTGQPDLAVSFLAA